MKDAQMQRGQELMRVELEEALKLQDQAREQMKQVQEQARRAQEQTWKHIEEAYDQTRQQQNHIQRQTEQMHAWAQIQRYQTLQLIEQVNEEAQSQHDRMQEHISRIMNHLQLPENASSVMQNASEPETTKLIQLNPSEFCFREKYHRRCRDVSCSAPCSRIHVDQVTPNNLIRFIKTLWAESKCTEAFLEWQLLTGGDKSLLPRSNNFITKKNVLWALQDANSELDLEEARILIWKLSD